MTEIAITTQARPLLYRCIGSETYNATIEMLASCVNLNLVGNNKVFEISIDDALKLSSITITEIAQKNNLSEYATSLFNIRQLIILALHIEDFILKDLNTIVPSVATKTLLYNRTLANVVSEYEAITEDLFLSHAKGWLLPKNRMDVIEFISTKNISNLSAFMNIDLQVLFEMKLHNILQILHASFSRIFFVNTRSAFWNDFCGLDDATLKATRLDALSKKCSGISISENPTMYGLLSENVDILPQFFVNDARHILPLFEMLFEMKDLDMRSITMLLQERLDVFYSSKPLLILGYKSGVSFQQLFENQLIRNVFKIYDNVSLNVIRKVFNLSEMDIATIMNEPLSYSTRSMPSESNKVHMLPMKELILLLQNKLPASTFDIAYSASVVKVSEGYTMQQLSDIYSISAEEMLQQANLITLSKLLFGTDVEYFTAIFKLNEDSHLASVNQTSIKTLSDLIQQTHTVSWKTKTFQWLRNYLFANYRDTVLLLSSRELAQMSGKVIGNFLNMGDTVEKYVEKMNASDFEDLVKDNHITGYIVPLEKLASIARTLPYQDIAALIGVDVASVLDMALVDLVKEIEKGKILRLYKYYQYPKIAF